MKHKEKQPIPLAVEFADMILTQSGLDNRDHCALSNLFDPFNTQSAQRGYCLLTWSSASPFPQSVLYNRTEGERLFIVSSTSPVAILVLGGVP